MVAGRFLAIAEGSAPASWMIDPMSATYCEGWGVEREVLRRGLRRYIDAFGPEGLCLDHHPAAVEAFRHFIDEPD